MTGTPAIVAAIGLLACLPQDRNTPPAPTRVVRFTPLRAAGGSARPGTCQRSLVSDRIDAYRCVVAETTYDPCFTTDGAGLMLCGVDPRDSSSGTIVTAVPPPDAALGPRVEEVRIAGDVRVSRQHCPVLVLRTHVDLQPDVVRVAGGLQRGMIREVAVERVAPAAPLAADVEQHALAGALRLGDGGCDVASASRAGSNLAEGAGKAGRRRSWLRAVIPTASDRTQTATVTSLDAIIPAVRLRRCTWQVNREPIANRSDVKAR